MIKKFTLVFTILTFFTTIIFAQNNKIDKNMALKTPTGEVGLMLGITNYQGDLIEPSFDFGVSNFAFGIYYGKYFGEKITGKLSVLIGGITGSDFDYESRVARGFVLEENALTAISLSANYFLLGENKYRKDENTAIYVSGGLGMAFFSPEPTGIPEGSEEDVNSAFGVMIGGGLKQHLSEKLSLGIDLSFRPLFSDLVDGISANGNPDNSDTYLWLGLTASYQLGDENARKK